MYTIKIYTILLYILHSLYNFARFIVYGCIYLYSILTTNNHVDTLKMEIKNLNKKPNHLVFMLGNEEPSFKDLANIVMWCTAAGISVISFYDHNGLLKQTATQLFKVLAENNIKFTSSNIKHQNGHKNGFNHPIQINIISMQDGQNALTHVAKDYIQTETGLSDVNIDHVDKDLRNKIGELPDPDLALYCGGVCSTFGLLPWQIRLTEFIDITSHRDIYLSKFISALRIYDRCEQRFGK